MHRPTNFKYASQKAWNSYLQHSLYILFYNTVLLKTFSHKYTRHSEHAPQHPSSVLSSVAPFPLISFATQEGLHRLSCHQYRCEFTHR